MEELILGIDDAGRGPVIGPMILAGCLIKKNHNHKLKRMGVKDSKQLTPKRRSILKKQIEELSLKQEIIPIFADEINKFQEDGIKLNEIEANAIAQIINKINNSIEEQIKVIIDCPSTGIKKWADYLKTKIEKLSNLEIVVEHKADKNHPSVSAASILAKCERETHMKELREKFPEIGSGYTSDPLTIKFIQKYAKEYEDEGIFRKHWITYKDAIKHSEQKTLF